LISPHNIARYSSSGRRTAASRFTHRNQDYFDYCTGLKMTSNRGYGVVIACTCPAERRSTEHPNVYRLG
jgi:hypothetical protein